MNTNTSQMHYQCEYMTPIKYINNINTQNQASAVKRITLGHIHGRKKKRKEKEKKTKERKVTHGKWVIHNDQQIVPCRNKDGEFHKMFITGCT